MLVYLLSLCLTLFLIPITLSGEGCQGRIDVGPAYVNIDMLESGHTARSLDLYGGKLDGTLTLYKGLCIKPSLLVANGKANLDSWSLGLGFCIPFYSDFNVTPAVGYTQTRFKSRLNLPQYGLYHLREKFKSQGMYVGADLCWNFAKTWRTYIQYQYSWSYVRTTLRPIYRVKDHTQGPSYALAVEKDLASWCSLSLAGGYNISLSKEKHGLRGKGIKLGFAVWY